MQSVISISSNESKYPMEEVVNQREKRDKNNADDVTKPNKRKRVKKRMLIPLPVIYIRFRTLFVLFIFAIFIFFP